MQGRCTSCIPRPRAPVRGGFCIKPSSDPPTCILPTLLDFPAPWLSRSAAQLLYPSAHSVSYLLAISYFTTRPLLSRYLALSLSLSLCPPNHALSLAIPARFAAPQLRIGARVVSRSGTAQKTTSSRFVSPYPRIPVSPYPRIPVFRIPLPFPYLPR